MIWIKSITAVLLFIAVSGCTAPCNTGSGPLTMFFESVCD